MLTPVFIAQEFDAVAVVAESVVRKSVHAAVKLRAL